MKTFILLSFMALLLCISCQPAEVCSAKASKAIINITGRFYFDDRFDRYALRHHVPGTIDAFHVYIFCDASSISDPTTLLGLEMRLSGTVGKLDEKLQPNTYIAGEEFFMIVSIEKLDPNQSRQ